MTKRRRRSAKPDSDKQQLCFGWDCVDFPFILKEAAEQRGERSANAQGLVQFLFDRIESATGTCTIEQDVIAAYLDCSRPTVARLVTRAEQVLGWIEIRTPARRGKGTTYWVNVAKVIADAGTSSRVKDLFAQRQRAAKQSFFTPSDSVEKVFTPFAAPNKEVVHEHEYENEYETHEGLDFRRDWGGRDWDDSDLQDPLWLKARFADATADDGPLRNHRSEVEERNFFCLAAQALIDKRKGNIKNAPGAFRSNVNQIARTGKRSAISTPAEKEGLRLWNGLEERKRERERASGGSSPAAKVAFASYEDPEAEILQRKEEQIALGLQEIKRRSEADSLKPNFGAIAERNKPAGAAGPDGLIVPQAGGRDVDVASVGSGDPPVNPTHEPRPTT